MESEAPNGLFAVVSKGYVNFIDLKKAAVYLITLFFYIIFDLFKRRMIFFQYAVR